MALLTKEGSNAKTAKSAKDGRFLSTIMHLAPANLSGRNVCSSASAGCIAACLNTAGRGRFDRTQQARINRTQLFFENRSEFVRQLKREIRSHVKRAEKLDKIPAVRLNGTSDILWEQVEPSIFDEFPEVRFYDYTKHIKRCRKGWKLPPNYHLTLSRSERNWSKCLDVLRDGVVNVAAVFSSKIFPTIYEGFPVYSADETDLRFLDPPGGHIGALYAKGEGKKDATGFVIHN